MHSVVSASAPDGGGVLHVVLGAGGGTGSAVARELVRLGRRVRVVTRKGRSGIGGGAQPPASFEEVAADVTDDGQLRRAVEGAAVVYHAAQPPYRRWAEEFPEMNRAIVAATGAAGAKLVFVDNLYMYGPIDGPITEESPTRPASKKGRVRAAMADELLAAHRAGVLRVTIGRASDYYGPGGPGSAVGERLFRAVLAGKKAQWFASLDQPHTLNYLDDMARALITLGDRPEADGRAWILPADAPLTGFQFVQLAARVAGTEVEAAVLGLGTVRLFGLFLPILREFPELWYQWAAPFVTDAGRFQAAFGPFTPTTHEEGLRRTLDWYKQAAPA
jgi:nucleoside-diphosphate-sugar epimerase